MLIMQKKPETEKNEKNSISKSKKFCSEAFSKIKKTFFDVNKIAVKINYKLDMKNVKTFYKRMQHQDRNIFFL